MASAQLEVGSAAAAVAPELRLYHLGHKGVTRMASLELCSPLPAAAHHVGAAVDGAAEDAHIGLGFYLAVLEGGEVVDLARRSSLDGRQFAASTHEEATVGYGEAAGKGITTVGKGKEEEGEKLLSANEEEKEDMQEKVGSSLGEEEEEEDWDETLGEDGEETAEEDGEATSAEDGDETSDDGEDGNVTSEEGEEGDTSSTEERDEWEESS